MGTRRSPTAKPRPRRRQPRHRPVAGGQAVGRSAGQAQRVDLLDQPVGRQQVGLPRARRAAHDVHGGGKGRVARQHRHAGGEPRVVGVADAQPRHVGDGVAGPGPHRAARVTWPARRPRSRQPPVGAERPGDQRAGQDQDQRVARGLRRQAIGGRGVEIAAQPWAVRRGDDLDVIEVRRQPRPVRRVEEMREGQALRGERAGEDVDVGRDPHRASGVSGDGRAGTRRPRIRLRSDAGGLRRLAGGDPP